MGLGGIIGGLLQQYAGNETPTNPDQHFDQVAQGVDQSSLTSAISGMMRSNETPPFGQIVGQMFQNGNGDQKASMLNTMLASAAPGVLSQLSGLIPGLSQTGLGPGGAITPAQAQALPPETVTQIASHVEQHDPSIVDRMSAVYAAHPILVKTLGTGAMIIALREMAKKFTPQP